MPVIKEVSIGEKNPLFLRFINRKIGVIDLLNIFSSSDDPFTANTAKSALENPPDIEYFRTELEEAVRDLAKEGVSEEFKAFVNHYMEDSIIQVSEHEKSPFGENRRQTVYIKNRDAPWIQGMVCYNLCLYIKVFGLDSLKICRTCGKLFAHKGRWALYCDDSCKPKKG